MRVGVGGPVGSGKTALMDALCKKLRDRYEIAAITNDIYTKWDAEYLVRSGALAAERIAGVETGGCPHTAIREDASINLAAVADMRAKFPDLDLVLIESGGDNLAATFSPELADLTIYVIDVAAGDKIPSKGGPGITRSDLLVINKIDLAPYVGASLEVMERDAKKMRGARPFVFTNLREGKGVDEIARFIERERWVGDMMTGQPANGSKQRLRASTIRRARARAPVSPSIARRRAPRPRPPMRAPGRHFARAARRRHRHHQGPVRRRRRSHPRRLQGAGRGGQAGRGRRAGRAASARGRRGDRRQDQHDRIRLFRHRHQSAFRHAGQSGRPRARARRLVLGRARCRPPTACARSPSAATPAARRRIPAALCGVVGFKPSRQRIPTDGAFPLSYTLDSIGPMATTVADCAKADAVMAGEEPRPLEPAPLAGLRLGVAQGLPLENLDDTVGKRFPAGARPAGKGRRAAVQRKAAAARRHDAAAIARGSILLAEAFAIHRDRLARRGDDVDQIVRARIEKGREISAPPTISTWCASAPR